MFYRKLNSQFGEFCISISEPQPDPQGWKAVLTIDSPFEDVRELNCYGVDALDALLYGVKLAAINVAAIKREGVDLRWLNDEDCGFDYALIT